MRMLPLCGSACCRPQTGPTAQSWWLGEPLSVTPSLFKLPGPLLRREMTTALTECSHVMSLLQSLLRSAHQGFASEDKMGVFGMQ